MTLGTKRSLPQSVKSDNSAYTIEEAVEQPDSSPKELKTLLNAEKNNDETVFTQPEKVKKYKKKRKITVTKTKKNTKEETKSTEELLRPMKEMIDNSPDAFILSYSQFKSFIETASRSNNVRDLA